MLELCGENSSCALDQNTGKCFLKMYLLALDPVLVDEHDSIRISSIAFMHLQNFRLKFSFI